MRWWEKTLNVLRAFAMSCILLVMQNPWYVIESNTMPFLVRHAPPRNQPVLSSSEHLVHAGNESGNGLLSVSEVTTRNIVLELKGV